MYVESGIKIQLMLAVKCRAEMHGSASFPFGKKSFFSRKVRKILMPVFLILSQNFTSFNANLSKGLYVGA